MEITRLWTLGHGSRPVGELVALLREPGVECLVDVRAYPVSRRHPQFARAALERSLEEAGIRYAWEGKSLGGRRIPAARSPHVALKDSQFRAYADHMTTALFREGLARMIGMARDMRCAIMCAERLPSECHRSFICDMLMARGCAVEHLVAAGDARPHVMNPAARVAGDALVYDAGKQLGLPV